MFHVKQQPPSYFQRPKPNTLSVNPTSQTKVKMRQTVLGHPPSAREGVRRYDRSVPCIRHLFFGYVSLGNWLKAVDNSTPPPLPCLKNRQIQAVERGRGRCKTLNTFHQKPPPLHAHEVSQPTGYSSRNKKGADKISAPEILTTHLISSSAIASICARLSSLRAALTVTVVSSNVIFLDFSNFALITLAAVGAHVPFSMIPIVRF